MSAQGANENTRSRLKADKEKELKVPGDSKFKQKFKQQRLAAWQPILTADTVLPAFFLIGLLFIPLGIALLFFSESVKEIQVDYTNCNSTDHKNDDSSPKPCQDVIDANPNESCSCTITFQLHESFPKNVYMYYGLDNFYQNHRRYVKSRDDKQLLGLKMTTPSTDCSPFDKNADGKFYAPCGAIANSMWNDTLQLYALNPTGEQEKVDLIGTDIAWASDKKIKFQNPPGSWNDSDPDFKFANTAKPYYWSKEVYQLDPDNPSNNGYENEDLIVWMRTAAFPNFRKLYRRIDHSKSGYKSGLPEGEYQLDVTYNYPVKMFSGRKRMILSSTSFLGGKNNFLGIAYITVGAICLLLGIIFLIIHIKFGKRASDHFNINQNTPYSE
ncbi:cell cycle control protein 50A isoform X2 [Oratosquilla oratoria]|uniref:cell cycle control protein 50A isoform X2 n=1 Tax=Oratosquilla oratoria TaxID=337810 RepID=UPI003F76DCD0